MMKTSARLALAASGLLGSAPLSLAQASAPTPVAAQAASPAPDSPDGDQADSEPPLTTPAFPVDEGLVRDTLEKASRPQPTVNTNATRARVRHTAKHRQRLHNSVSVASRDRKEKSTVAARAHPTRHRNPVARFVFWWNGWVIRTFHTKLGTVMLKTIGAQS